MSGSSIPPTPPTGGSTGDIIGADIAAINNLISPIISALGPQGAAIGSIISVSLGLASKLEPVIYNTLTALFQGTPLTPQQQTDMQAAIERLQNPDQYYA